MYKMAKCDFCTKNIEKGTSRPTEKFINNSRGRTKSSQRLILRHYSCYKSLDFLCQSELLNNTYTCSVQPKNPQFIESSGVESSIFRPFLFLITHYGVQFFYISSHFPLPVYLRFCREILKYRWHGVCNYSNEG